MDEELILRSSIRSGLLKTALIKGFSMAFIGAFGLLLAGIFLPPPLLKGWGLLLFILFIGLMASGLIPYKRLLQLQTKPNELRAVGLKDLEYWSKGQKIISIPLESILEMNFVDDQNKYGIALKTHPKGIEINKNNLQRFQVLTGSTQRWDYLFLYFSKRSLDELQAWRHTDSSNRKDL